MEKELLHEYLTVNECDAVSETVLKFSAPKNEHLVIGELSEDHEELEEQIDAFDASGTGPCAEIAAEKMSEMVLGWSGQEAARRRE